MIRLTIALIAVLVGSALAGPDQVQASHHGCAGWNFPVARAAWRVVGVERRVARRQARRAARHARLHAHGCGEPAGCAAPASCAEPAPPAPQETVQAATVSYRAPVPCDAASSQMAHRERQPRRVCINGVCTWVY